MNKKLKIAAWVTTIAISFSLTAPLQAKDHELNRNKQRNGHEIIITTPNHAYESSNERYRKMMKKQNKMRKIRRLRRINTQYNWEHHNTSRPITVISANFFKH